MINDIAEKIEDMLLRGEDIWKFVNSLPRNSHSLEALLSVLKDFDSYEIYDAVLSPTGFMDLLDKKKYREIVEEYRKYFDIPLSFDPFWIDHKSGE